jgi:hypothetical protein
MPEFGIPPPFGAVTLYVLGVVPAVWWFTAAAAGKRMSVARGAGAEAMCGGVIILVPATILAVGMVLKPGDGSGALAGVFGFLVLVGATAILVPLGAAIGALSVLLQRESHRQQG